MDIKNWFELKLDVALAGDVWLDAALVGDAWLDADLVGDVGLDVSSVGGVWLEVSLNRFVLQSWEIEKLVAWTKPTAAVSPSPLGLKGCERCSNWSKVHPFSHPVISGVTSSIKWSLVLVKGK